MLLLNWKVRSIHVFREVNVCAGLLANLGCSRVQDREVYVSPPAILGPCLVHDVMGVPTPRVVNL